MKRKIPFSSRGINGKLIAATDTVSSHCPTARISDYLRRSEQIERFAAAVNEMLVNNEPATERRWNSHCGSLSQLEVVVNDVAIAAPHNKDGGEVGPVGGCGGDPSSFFSSVSFPRRFT